MQKGLERPLCAKAFALAALVRQRRHHSAFLLLIALCLVILTFVALAFFRNGRVLRFLESEQFGVGSQRLRVSQTVCLLRKGSGKRRNIMRRNLSALQYYFLRTCQSVACRYLDEANIQKKQMNCKASRSSQVLFEKDGSSCDVLPSAFFSRRISILFRSRGINKKPNCSFRLHSPILRYFPVLCCDFFAFVSRS